VKRRGKSAIACALLLGCSARTSPTKPASGALPEGQAVRAGRELVSGATITRIAQHQGIAPAAAASAALSDALFAQGARDRVPVGTSRSIERAAVARALIEQLGRAARSAGPPSAAELAEVVRERWTDLDRPVGARTSHAVVLNDKPERDAAAKALGQKLAEALQGVASADDLIKKAEEFPAQGFTIKAQSLPFLTADGRTFQHRESGFVATPATFDVDFARAALALERPGQLSGVIKSRFGYHVIFLEERAPEQIVPKEQLPTLLAPEVEQRRAALARRELLERLHAAATVQLDRAFDELTANVKVAP